MLQISNSEKKPQYIITGTLITAILLSIYAVQLSVPVIGDETVTMGNVAWLEGYDWSFMIAALGGLYYRYAQALMTIPFFKCFTDPADIYRWSMVLQAVIQSSIVPVVYVICRRHLRVKERGVSVLLGMAVCLIPSMALYTLYYRGDYLLGVLPWFALLFFLETIHACDTGQKTVRIICTVMTASCCALAYMAHTRGIVLCVAVILCALLLRIFEKIRSLDWIVLFLILIVLFLLDQRVGGILKSALYSIGGVSANAVETTDMGSYFNILSLSMLKSIVMLCICWMYTLASTTQGLVLMGIITGLLLVWKILVTKNTDISKEEKTVIFFSILVFLGYYAIGALYFKGAYYELRTGALERRVDRVIYDRYAICGAGMVVFLSLYALCSRKEWINVSERIGMIAGYAGIGAIFLWKAYPEIIKYKGYIYNTIVLNTLSKRINPAKILSGDQYSGKCLIGMLILGFILMLTLLYLSQIQKKNMSYLLLVFVLLSDLFFIQINYVKIRKASNDYVTEATHDVVQFMQQFEDEVTGEFPYILKGGLSGIKIQFYQSQLMSYKMFGKKQKEQVNADNYFIISKHDDIDMTWYNQDYYLFDDFDYENADYDIIYVKGEQLKEKMEQLGYTMVKYEKSAVEPFY